MQNYELSPGLHQKRFLIGSFLHSINLPGSDDPKLLLKQRVTNHFLEAMVLELLIKMLFEMDQRQDAPYTHQLPKIYEKLNKATQAVIEESYDKVRHRTQKMFSRSQIPDVIIHPLDTILKENEKLVKNFKYDAQATGSNPVFDNRFYKEILSYIDHRMDEP